MPGNEQLQISSPPNISVLTLLDKFVSFLLAKLSRLFAKFSANFNAAIMLRFEWISMQTKKGGCLPGQIGLPHLGVGQDEKVPKEPSEIA